MNRLHKWWQQRVLPRLAKLKPFLPVLALLAFFIVWPMVTSPDRGKPETQPISRLFVDADAGNVEEAVIVDDHREVKVSLKDGEDYLVVYPTDFGGDLMNHLNAADVPVKVEGKSFAERFQIVFLFFGLAILALFLLWYMRGGLSLSRVRGNKSGLMVVAAQRPTERFSDVGGFMVASARTKTFVFSCGFFGSLFFVKIRIMQNSIKTFIKNRDGNKICVVVEKAKQPGKLAFVMHGLGGNKTHRHIRAMAEAFLESGYTVVTFDTVHTFGESEGGKYEDATITNYYADLEDVIAWASQQGWYSDPFILCGHSLGGISTALFAQKHPEKVQALAPIATVVSGELSVNSKEPGDLAAWQRNGVKVTMSRDGTREKRLKWSFMEDRMRYDLLPEANKLRMPVLMIVGDQDDSTLPEHQQILFHKLPGKKELHMIKGALHSFYEPHEQAELKQLIKHWLKKL